MALITIPQIVTGAMSPQSFGSTETTWPGPGRAHLSTVTGNNRSSHQYRCSDHTFHYLALHKIPNNLIFKHDNIACTHIIANHTKTSLNITLIKTREKTIYLSFS